MLRCPVLHVPFFSPIVLPLFLFFSICSIRSLWGSSKFVGFGFKLTWCHSRPWIWGFFGRTISTVVPTIPSSKVGWFANVHHLTCNLSGVQHDRQQFRLPHLPPGEGPQVTNCRPSPSSCCRVAPLKLTEPLLPRYVLGEMNRSDLLKDVSCNMLTLLLGHLAWLYSNTHPLPLDFSCSCSSSCPCSHSCFTKVPDNLALEGLAGGLIEAWRIYKRPE